MLATETVLADRYRLEQVIGRGGVADVYRALDLASGEPVAVKVLRQATGTDLRRFEREARTLERLDHPAIVRLRDEGERDGVPYLVLDLVDGEPLSHLLRRGPLPEAEVAVVAAPLAGALAHAHGLGIVHRDVKPGNVLLDRAGRPHLSDFGIARLVDAASVTSITDTGFVIGTASYLAPEQVRGASAGPEADIYSLGLVLLEALTGERVFTGSPTEAAMARLERAPEIPPASPWLASLLTAMTQLDPARRPRAEAVADAFAARGAEDAGDHTTVLPIVQDATTAIAAPAAAAVATPPPARAASPIDAIRHRGRVVAVVAVAALALALLLFSFAGRSPSSPAGADSSTTVPAAVTTAPTTAPTTNPAPTPPRPRKGKGHGDG